MAMTCKFKVHFIFYSQPQSSRKLHAPQSFKLAFYPLKVTHSNDISILAYEIYQFTMQLNTVRAAKIFLFSNKKNSQ